METVDGSVLKIWFDKGTTDVLLKIYKYNQSYKNKCMSVKFRSINARYWMLGASALGRPRGMVWGGRKEEGSGWGAHVYLWRIHFDIWQN